VPAEATAFAHRGGRFLLKHGLTVPAAGEGAGRCWLRRSRELAHLWGTGGSYHTSNAARVRRVGQRYDPERRFDPEAERGR
jgi:hypothetical protein